MPAQQTSRGSDTLRRRTHGQAGHGSGDRPGHHLEPRHRVRCRLARPGARAARVRPALSRPRAGSSTTRRTSGARRWRPPGRRSAAAELGAGDIAAIGITNQRETCVVWDRRTGRPIHRAIVWQDRRTAETCRSLKRAGHEPAVTAKTGLLLDPYFSATKIAWLLDHVDGARALAEAGRSGLRHGRQLSCLAPHRRQGARHRRHQRLAHAALRHRQGRLGRRSARALRRAARDPAGGARLQCRSSARPSPRSSAAPIPIAGVAGDQQAATIGQACFAPGMVKATYGTGCFALLNTGAKPVASQQPAADHRRLPARRQAHLRAGGRHLHRRRGRAVAARRAAPHRLGGGDRRARRQRRSRPGRLPRAGLRRPRRALLAARGARRPLRPDARHRPDELARAALEAVCYQTRDLLEAMRSDWRPRGQGRAARRRRHGGERLDHAVPRRHSRRAGRPADHRETTALGAAWLAGHKAGVWPDAEGFAQAVEARPRASSRRWRRPSASASMPAGSGRSARCSITPAAVEPPAPGRSSRQELINLLRLS